MKINSAKNSEALHDLIHNCKLTPNTLVIYDVDEVLISLEDKILRPCVDRDPNFKNPFYEIFYPLEDPEKTALFGEFISQAKVVLLDPKTPEYVQSIQSKSKVIGLTRMIPGAGTCGKIKSMEEFRHNELKVLGIDFGNSFPETPFIDLSASDKDYDEKDRKAIFKQDIIYAYPHGKDKALGLFLDKIGFYPDQVIFVDDQLKNLTKVAEEMEKSGIPFIGIHYQDESLSKETFDKELGKFQYDYFIKNKIWLSDAQARKIHQKQKDSTVLFSYNQQKRRRTEVDEVREEAIKFVGSDKFLRDQERKLRHNK